MGLRISLPPVAAFTSLVLPKAGPAPEVWVPDADELGTTMGWKMRFTNGSVRTGRAVHRKRPTPITFTLWSHER